jgi:hypothetical protein
MKSLDMIRFPLTNLSLHLLGGVDGDGPPTTTLNNTDTSYDSIVSPGNSGLANGGSVPLVPSYMMLSLILLMTHSPIMS